MALPVQQQILRVTDVTRYLKYLVEQDGLLTALSVQGEISDFSRAPSGHVYFTLKDSGSQISCVLFRREALQQPEQTKDLRKGLTVIVHGFLMVYEARGTYQIVVERIVLQGQGALFKRIEALKAKLEADGLFAAERKRPLPAFPKTLALVTSPGSQAYHDVLHRLSVQYPLVRVIEVGVSVQGDGAADEMALAIDVVNRLTNAEIILLVRGGGAPEELASFNEERLVRAIFASRTPVITGVGHETDHTIVDLVADRRAATPSLAAAVAVPDRDALVQRLASLHTQMRIAMGRRLQVERVRLLQDNQALIRASPHNRLHANALRTDSDVRHLHRAMGSILSAKRARVAALNMQLQVLNPLTVLKRGYALLTDVESGTIVSRVEQAVPGKRVQVRVSDGEFTAQLENG